jgi:small basic protein
MLILYINISAYYPVVEPSLQTSLEPYLSIACSNCPITKFSLFFELFQEHETKVFHEHYFFILTMNIEIVIVTHAVMVLHPLFPIFQVFIEILTYICSVCILCVRMYVCMYV